ncbi:radical SAM protein [Desulfogranum marinum]|uniref:radical SAM protein n=1 Tax=Desulfogranum marinum TaxID=453220 RepID=UPI001965EDA6|nr:radical SAM protein [Desulfogranum marinum]MBM9511870.1 radical SAM protein [Desulfogranum marinum]
MHYEGPIYRPPSEADSLLIQATVGCPHNKCTFCMVYKNGPPFKVRPVAAICKDMEQAAQEYGAKVSTLFFPAGNTIAMKTKDLCTICEHAYQLFPKLERITVYGSFQYIHAKGLEELQQLVHAGLTRIHVGLESGDDEILRRICKGTNSTQQIEAGQWVMRAGMELSLYAMLGIGGKERTMQHAAATAKVLDAIEPTFIRLRTFLPKKDTPLLEDILNHKFSMLGPHEVLLETKKMLEQLNASSLLTSDHYTNYINLEGKLPSAKPLLINQIDQALQRAETTFRPVYIGNQ